MKVEFAIFFKVRCLKDEGNARINIKKTILVDRGYIDVKGEFRG